MTKRRQKNEILATMRSFVLKKIPKNGVKKVKKSEIYFKNKHDLSDDDFVTLAYYADSFPKKKYNKIVQVSVGHVPGFKVYFTVK